MSFRALPKRSKAKEGRKDDAADVPRHCLRHQQRRPSRQPIRDTEHNVIAETDCVFRNFVYQMYVNDVTNRPDDELPSIPEVRTLGEQPVTPLAEIGRQLAAVGDEINDRYRPQFRRMIRRLNLTPDTAYDLLADVARKLFDDGTISWGRVVALLCFGYHMALAVIRRGMGNFFAGVVRFIVRFILLENIAKWIAEQGGWRAVLTHIPESIGWSTIGLIFALSALSVITVVCLSRNQ